MEKRLAAILISDIVGYTKLMEEDTEGTVMAWSDARDNVIELEVEAANGRLVKFMGDGFLAEFSTVQTALECAIAIQNGVKDNSLKFRMAIHLGDIIDDGKDIYGEGINIASRLEGVAEPGGICISGDVYNQVRNRIPAEYDDIGLQEVKNVAEPIQAYSVNFDGLVKDKEKSGNPISRDKSSLAVLPLNNMSGETDQEYFSDGITEDLITALSRIKFLDVIARNSTFAYKNSSPDIRKVSEELGVRYVVEGSVRKAGTKIRLNIQLLAGSNGSHIWAKKYDGAADDIFQLQDDFIDQVAREIQPHLLEREVEHARRLSKDEMGPWDAVHRAIWHYKRHQNSDLTMAMEWSQHAIDLDPELGLPFALKGTCLGVLERLHNTQIDEDPIALGKKAISLGPGDPLTRALMGHIYHNAGMNDAAEDEYRTSIDLNPNNGVPWFGLGWMLIWNDRYEEGRESIIESLQLEPNDPMTGRKHVALAVSHLGENSLEEARNAINKAVLSGVQWPAYVIQASIYALTGELEIAKPIIENVLKEQPDLEVSSFIQMLSSSGRAVEQIANGLKKLNIPS